MLYLLARTVAAFRRVVLVAPREDDLQPTNEVIVKLPKLQLSTVFLIGIAIPVFASHPGTFTSIGWRSTTDSGFPVPNAWHKDETVVGFYHSTFSLTMQDGSVLLWTLPPGSGGDLITATGISNLGTIIGTYRTTDYSR